MNFGYPYCHQGDLADPEFGKKHSCSEFTPPALKLGAHVATCPLSVLLQLTRHPLTDAGLARFIADWEKVPR